MFLPYKFPPQLYSRSLLLLSISVMLTMGITRPCNDSNNGFMYSLMVPRTNINFEYESLYIVYLEQTEPRVKSVFFFFCFFF